MEKSGGGFDKPTEFTLRQQQMEQQRRLLQQQLDLQRQQEILQRQQLEIIRSTSTISGGSSSGANLDPYQTVNTPQPEEFKTNYSILPSELRNVHRATNRGVEMPPHTQRSTNVSKLEVSWYWRYLTGTPAVILGAVLGIFIGILLSRSDPSTEVADWIALPGELFIRALKLLVVPMVFSSLTVGMADILSVGKGNVIGWRMATYFVVTSAIASIQAILWGLLFRRYFYEKSSKDETSDPVVALQCSNQQYLTLVNGVLSCSAPTADGNGTRFLVNDLNDAFVLTNDKYSHMTLSQQVIGLLKQIVPSNITSSFSNGELLSVVMFAIPFGVAVAKSHQGRTTVNHLLEFLRQVSNAFLLLIRWIIKLTPVAVISLIAGSLARNNDLSILKSLGAFLGAMTCGVSVHMGLVMPLMFYFFTRSNPYVYMRNIVPAQVFAFGCASSMATLPVTMRCVDATKQVSRSLSRFVLSLGTTINMDGAAIYFPLGIIFMAETSGMAEKLGAVQFILLVIVATMASIGGAPVPNAGLVLLITVWTTIMNTDLPPSFSFLVAIDWISDRLRTVANVTGDTMIARIIADQVDETYLDEQDRNQNLS